MNENALSEKKLAYTVDEAAESLGVGRVSIYYLFRDGSLTARRFGRKTLILRDDLVRYLESLPTGVAKLRVRA